MDPLAELIRRIRDARGWTQEDFAREIGVKAISVRSYERGRRAPSARVLMHMVALAQGKLREELLLAMSPAARLMASRLGITTSGAGDAALSASALLTKGERDLVESWAKEKRISVAEQYADLIRLGLSAAIASRTSRQQQAPPDFERMYAAERQQISKEKEADARSERATSSARSRSKGRSSKTA